MNDRQMLEELRILLQDNLATGSVEDKILSVANTLHFLISYLRGSPPPTENQYLEAHADKGE